MVILVDLSAIFLASHCQFWHGSLANGMAFQSCSVHFRDPIDLLLSCLSQTKHPNIIMSTASYTWVRWKDSSAPAESYESRSSISDRISLGLQMLFLDDFEYTGTLFRNACIGMWSWCQLEINIGMTWSSSALTKWHVRLWPEIRNQYWQYFIFSQSLEMQTNRNKYCNWT